MNKIDKIKIGLSIILIFSAVGLFSGNLYQTSLFQAPKLEIPASKWEEIFFRAINQNTNLVGIEKLREKHLSKNDIEIRVWEGFGLEPLEGMIFQKIDNVWSAHYVLELGTSDRPASRITQLPQQPKSGWDSFIQQISDEGIFDLPDATSIDCEYQVIDGRGYVVETYKNKIYRTYRYNELSENKCFEGKKMGKIVKIIADEFYNGIDECKTTEWIPCYHRFK